MARNSFLQKSYRLWHARGGRGK